MTCCARISVSRSSGKIADGSDEGLRRADITQPMPFAVTRVLRDMGTTPAEFVGHRVGKIAAALAALRCCLTDAALIVTIHGIKSERAARME